MPTFRSVGQGEERQYATLERIECAADRVVLHFRVGDAPMHARARRLGDVEFISYRDDLKGSVGCGAREPPDVVYATLRGSADPAVKEVVAVEFLPKGYSPR